MNLSLAVFPKICTLISGQKLIILKYHRVFDSFDFMYPGEVDRVAFSWQMALLARYFNVLSLSDALEGLATHSLPARSVCITFDDGYADNYLNALPILLENNLQATFFIASGYLDGGRMWNDTITEAVRNMEVPQLDLSALGYGGFDISTPEKKAQAAVDITAKVKHLPPLEREAKVNDIATLSKDLRNDLMLTTGQLVGLSQAGMEIGGHTLTHPILATLDVERANFEVAENKRILEEKLNKKIRYFAYPNGKPGSDYLPEQVDIIRKNGYEAAVSTVWGVSTNKTDRWQLKRSMPWDRSPEKFMKRLMVLYTGLE